MNSLYSIFDCVKSIDHLEFSTIFIHLSIITISILTGGLHD